MKPSKKYFGTDGIRGRVGEFPITVEFLLKLGWAAGRILKTPNHAKVVIGKDTRISGYMIESTLQAGLSAAGVHIYLLGPIPTPAIAYFTRTLRADAGIVISASHNPYEDNGIKFFSPDGYKLPDTIELNIEHQLDYPIETVCSKLLGKAWRINDAAGRYIEYCKSSVPHNTHFMNVKIIVDCANGATYHIAPNVFNELNADVIKMNASPNGLNINRRCGSTHPETVREAVLKENADVGIAFDGDGDRVVMVDHHGDILDGDDILYIMVKGLLSRNITIEGVVGTPMTNRGLELALNEYHIPLVRVPVGDQHIIHELIQRKWILGGEPSGHISYLNMNTTGDGIITALQVLQYMIASGKSLHELKAGIKKFPQKIINILYINKIDLNDTDIVKAVHAAEIKVKPYGRVYLRYSGTEPLLRLMVEAEDPIVVDNIILELKDMLSLKVGQS